MKCAIEDLATSPEPSLRLCRGGQVGADTGVGYLSSRGDQGSRHQRDAGLRCLCRPFNGSERDVHEPINMRQYLLDRFRVLIH